MKHSVGRPHLPVTMIEDGVMGDHADEDVEEGGVDVRNNPQLVRS